MTFTQWLAEYRWWILMCAWALVVVGIVTLLHKRVVQFDEAEARKAKTLELVALSDEWDAATTDKERSAIYRKAAELGFCDDSGNETEFESDYHPHPRDAA